MIRFPRSVIAIVSALAMGAIAVACSASRPEFEPGDPDASGPPVFGNDPDAGDSTKPLPEAGPGIFNDAEPPIDGATCLPDAGGPGPVKRLCLPPTDNECDGYHDLPTFPANGIGGNGFDDDCDGLVDEGCSCRGAGTTKECYLVPASQTFGGIPVGWCATNAKGTVDCKEVPSEISSGGTWSGVCRGAQLPYQDDFCANGDFNCDGKDQNSTSQDCSCKGDPVQCPTDALTTAPFPPPASLPLKIDAASWFLNAADVNNAQNWKWTLIGGDCDNIIPHPTFSIYGSSNGSGVGVGTQVDTLGVSGKEHGYVALQPAVTSAIYPAFALSGDYITQGEFDLNGRHFSCQQKIQVRAPGLRTEACWDTEGSVDLDLHMAYVDQLNNCEKTGWTDATCPNQDCYYANCAGGESTGWFATNPVTTACQGWGSRRTGACSNPRLDRDVVSCTRSETNPNASSYCGPENINVDAPPDGAKFAVSLRYFGGSQLSRPHVNVYCNGERILSAGYNPTVGVDFPKLSDSGSDTSGDMWKVAMITTHTNAGMLTCDVVPVPSRQPRIDSEGSAGYCVDNADLDTADAVKLFTPGGAIPLDAEAMCFH